MVVGPVVAAVVDPVVATVVRKAVVRKAVVRKAVVSAVVDSGMVVTVGKKTVGSTVVKVWVGSPVTPTVGIGRTEVVDGDEAVAGAVADRAAVGGGVVGVTPTELDGGADDAETGGGVAEPAPEP